MFQLLSLNLIVLVKSSVTVFSSRRERCFPGGCVLEGHGWDGTPWDQLLINWFANQVGSHTSPLYASIRNNLLQRCLGLYLSLHLKQRPFSCLSLSSTDINLLTYVVGWPSPICWFGGVLRVSDWAFFRRARCWASYKRTKPMAEVRVFSLPDKTFALMGSFNLLTKQLTCWLDVKVPILERRDSKLAWYSLILPCCCNFVNSPKGS